MKTLLMSAEIEGDPLLVSRRHDLINLLGDISTDERVHDLDVLTRSIALDLFRAIPPYTNWSCMDPREPMLCRDEMVLALTN
jgi:hypothetical protein